MMDCYDVFLSYSRNDREAVINLRGQLQRCGLYVFKDDERIRAGELWLDRLQEAVGSCSAFVVLVGRDGVRRWIGAETQVALDRYFAPHDEALRLPIFPILLEGTEPETLPAFLRLFQMTPWNGADVLPERLLDDIRHRTIITNKEASFEGCPFVGLAAFRIDQAHLFFGRQKETLDALTCFDTRRGAAIVRWLEINGNSGSGKSSLMQAGLLPLIDQGWLWPRTGYGRWWRIGPMMPGRRPVEMLAECLAHAFRKQGEKVEMADIRPRLETDDRGLTNWLRTRKQDDTAFLLAVDQFEELFTFADPGECGRFDRLLAGALEDVDCPLFVISTVRTDFLDRFAEDTPRLVAVRNRLGKSWTLPLISADSLREVITGPARLARLDVSAVEETMVAEARDEPGVLPLVQNALHWLWVKRTGNRLSGQLFTEQGGLAGILSHSADDLLAGLDADQRDRALELLFRLVRVDPEGSRHTRRRVPFAEAVNIAGNGECGRALVNCLAGERALEIGTAGGPVRLITITEEGRWVSLIHEMLIRSKGLDAAGKPQPYWPTLWSYIEEHKGRAFLRDRVHMLEHVIEDAAAAWNAIGRAESGRWPEDRLLQIMCEIIESGESIDAVIRPGISRAFFGPMDPQEIINMLALTAEENVSAGSGRYGDAWRLPLGHEARAALAERLALLGDNRPGVGLRADGLPDIDWCQINGGEVTIESRSQVVEPFRMARYLLTIDQFEAFVEDCYRDGKWQPQVEFLQDFPHDDPPEHSISSLARARRTLIKQRMNAGRGSLQDPAFGPYHEAHHGNYPADGVSWYDATAFCHWLSVRLGFEIRLPTEFEWQLTASGGDPKRTYPWGPDWDPSQQPWLANTDESGLRHPMPVGFYPLGASPAGVLDMAGNVWEWCLDCEKVDLSRPRPWHRWYRRFSPRRFLRIPAGMQFSDDLGRRCLLRGGSWSAGQDDARSASRFAGAPCSRGLDVGFRVVCSSLPSGSDQGCSVLPGDEGHVLVIRL